MALEMILKLEKVSKNFGGIKALDGVELSLEEGEIVGLIGPNGAGKTTLFNVITGFYKPDTGAVFFNGEDITSLPTHKICRKGIARTFQIAKPYEEITVLKTVTIGAMLHSDSMKQAAEKAEVILSKLKLHDKKQKLGRSLTVVERKRLELARALATEPKLLLIDEVIAGLNPTEIDDISEIIRGLAKSGISILMIEHVMRAILSLAKHAIVLDAGCKIAEGESENLLKEPTVIEAYIGREDSDV